MRIGNWGVVAGILVVMLFVRGVWAGTVVPAAPQEHYYQEVNFLSNPAVEGDVEILLSDFERNVGRQIVVAVYGGMETDLPVHQYALYVAEVWREKGLVKKDGVVIFVFPGMRKAEIVPGEGLEEVLPFESCEEIVSHDGMPGMRSGEHEGAIKNMLESVMLGVQGLYVRPSTIVLPPRHWYDNLCGELFCCGLLVFFVLLIFVPKPKGYVYTSSGPTSSGGGSVMGVFAVVGLVAGVASVFSGGGGFSKSGGGSFGGGGAGGAW